MIKNKYLLRIFSGKRAGLALLPLLFFGVGLAVILTSEAFFQRSTDPEYFHLLNGINIALFNLATPYTAHPGTPLQLIVAISSWPIGLFLDGPLVQNVIDHPELFLKGAIVLKILIIAVAIFIAGHLVFSSTHNIWYALLIQLLPFGSAYAMTVIGRLNPESFMPVPVLLLSTMLIRIFYEQSSQDISHKKIRQLALIGGFGMAIKFSYFPFLLIPVFLMKSFNKLLRYAILCIVFTLLFAFPVLFNFSDTGLWFGHMLVNSGQWGSGESTFIDWSTVPERLSQLIQLNYLFPALLIFLIALMIFVRFSKKDKNRDFKVLNFISAGVILGIVFSVFLITKHFAYRYYIPTLLFQTVLFYLIVEYAVRMFRFKMPQTSFAGLAFGVYFLISAWQMADFKQRMETIHHDRHAYALQCELLEKSRKENIPVIISSFYAGCPFPEFSLNEGYMLCGNLKSTFSEALRQKYPQTTMYVDWSEQFYHWNLFLDADDFIEPSEGLYVFIGQGKAQDFDVIMTRLKAAFPEFLPQAELLVHYENPDEYFYKISFTEK